MNKVLVIGSVLLAIVAITLGVYSLSRSPRMVYVNIEKVYNDFELKKELEKKMQDIAALRGRKLDSLEGAYKVQMGLKADAAKLNAIRQEYEYSVKVISEDNERAIQGFKKNIHDQLEQYLKDYVSENKLDYIITSSEGSWVIAKPENDRSEEVLTYVNKRYAGKK